MYRSLVAMTLVMTMLSAPLAPALRAQERPYAKQTAEPAPTGSTIATGREAEKLLDDTRLQMLRALQETSRRSVALAVDRASLAVLQLDLEVPLDARSPEAAQAAGVAFLNTYQGLLDPMIDSSDLVLAEADGCNSASTVVFDRVVNGTAVLGSKLTLQFSGEGALVGVTNALASAPREVQPAVKDERVWARVREVVPPEQLEEVLQKGRKVLVAEQQDGRADLREATLLTWREEPPDDLPQNKALLVGVQGGVSNPFVSVSPAGLEKTLKVAEPIYHTDGQTGQTDAISYHDVGGAAVGTLPLDRNPYETVYRFLQEHPSLFRTGAARCQFAPRSVSESQSLPGVQFVRMQQRYVGLPVAGAELVFEIHDKSKVMSVAGHVLPNIEVDPVPQIAEADAVSAARQAAINALYTYTPWTYSLPSVQAVASAPATSELVVFPGPIVPDRNLPTRLAYKVAVDQFVYFIDANNGNELLGYSTRASQSAPVIRDATALSEIGWPAYVTVQVGPTPTGALPLNTDVTPIFGSMSSVAAFYAGLGWFGLNGSGSRLTANTNVAMLTGCANAFFDSWVTGDAFFCLGVGSQPDVVGHEFTHGVIANSSGLVYLDEPGALNESYADLFGNLIFPDAIAPGALSGWLVGEPATVGGPAVGTGTIRDMAVPGNFGQPATMAGFVSRSAAGSGCNVLPISCDFGFVHTNSGIVNRAHVLLAGTPGGAAPTPPIPGIGRAKLATLALEVMTKKLTPWARLVDAAIATEWMARTLVMRGATTPGGAAFVQTDVDQVPQAFGLVGLSPSLSTGWSEPLLGFSGVDTFFPTGETTASGCTITNVQAPMSTLSGQLMADLSPLTSEPPSVNYFGVWGIGFSPLPAPGVTLPPIGGTAKTHSISWFNIFGHKPGFYTTIVEAPPPAGAVDCITPVGSTPVQRVTNYTAHWAVVVGGKGDETAGNPASTMSSSCAVTKTEIELVDNSGNVIAGPAATVKDTVILGWFFSVPITASRGANLTTAGPGAPPNMTAGVHWWHEGGVAVRYRLRYYISQPNGTSCTSATEF